jgi:hypothetical protein
MAVVADAAAADAPRGRPVAAGLSTNAAKDHHKRQRLVMRMNDGTCGPSSEAALSNDGSYPSGHAALSRGRIRC